MIPLSATRMVILSPDSTIFSHFCNNTASNHLFLIKRSTFFHSTTTSAKKNNVSEDQNSKLQISTTFLAQSASVLFALGFIDAGYSGDWSRIGVISKETEGLLRAGAFLVVPLCLFLVFWVWNKSKEVS